MKNHINKLLIIICLTFIFGNSFSQEGLNVEYKLNGFKGNIGYLASIYGSNNVTIDTAIGINNTFIFSLDKMLEPGMYQIYFNDNLYTDIIINNENVKIETSVNNIIGDMKVHKSDENRVLFDYWKFVLMIKDSIRELSVKGNKLLKKSGGKKTAELDELQNKVDKLNNRIVEYSNALIEENPESFVAVILKAYQLPDYNNYLKQPEAKPYSNLKDFYEVHFFDNMDFSDSRLLRTEIIYIAINDYMKNYTKDVSTEKYIKVIDLILSKASVNEDVYQYAINLFVSNFGYSIWEKVYVHIIENHLLKNSNTDSTVAAFHRERINALENINIGSPAPKLLLKDVNQKDVDFYSIKGKAKLLFYWGTGCENCERMLPDLKDIYKKYNKMGFEIIAIAITSDEDEWKHKIKKHNAKWIDLSDLKGAESEIILKYNVWLTPSLFLLDKNNKIVSRSNDMIEIQAKLVELLSQ